ncbi:MAG: 1-acyl-sn-glycerol-3-phosphate acyltransferase [Chloroflexota bacterium]|nr:1-acyl-sn-glycerol-3-phosphate acyltransferase [Chloroflexota bacterium]
MFRLARAIAGPLLRATFDYHVSGREKIPAGPYVAIANHLNWVDPWTLLMVFPVEPRMHFLANPENLVRHRVHWAFVKSVGGYIPVDLKHGAGSELFRHVDHCLQVGGVVGIFPEAAYGPREGELQETFKAGFAHFAVDNQVPVLPVALSGTKDLWLRKRIEVVIGSPLPPGGDVDALIDRSRVALLALLPKYEEPPGRKPLRRFLTKLLY